MNGNFKEFHLVAEPVVRELAPGMNANLWGYAMVKVLALQLKLLRVIKLEFSLQINCQNIQVFIGTAQTTKWNGWSSRAKPISRKSW